MAVFSTKYESLITHPLGAQYPNFQVLQTFRTEVVKIRDWLLDCIFLCASGFPTD